MSFFVAICVLLLYTFITNYKLNNGWAELLVPPNHIRTHSLLIHAIHDAATILWILRTSRSGYYARRGTDFQIYFHSCKLIKWMWYFLGNHIYPPSNSLTTKQNQSFNRFWPFFMGLGSVLMIGFSFFFCSLTFSILYAFQLSLIFNY